MKTDLTPQELMKAMGAPAGFFDPIPPGQHAWPMQYGNPPLFRLWSWMCAHSIRKGRRKGYVCDERGRALTVEDAAHDLGMDPGVCRRAWREGAALGLWRKGTHASDKRCLILNGKVVPVAVEPESEPETEAPDAENSDTEIGEEKAKKVCTDLFPPYISMQIKRLPKTKRAILLAEHAGNERLKLAVHADVTVAVRLIFDQRENNIFSKFGIKKIREEHTPKNGSVRSPVRTKLVQEFLPGLEKFVQTFEERSVQAQAESVHTEENPVVQTAQKTPGAAATPTINGASTSGSKRAVLESQRSSLPPSSSSYSLQSDDDERVGKASSKNTTAEAHTILRVMRLFSSADDEAAVQLLRVCRENAPDCTVAQIAGAVEIKGPLAKKKDNPVGFLLIAVPKLFVGNTRNEAKKEWVSAPQQHRCACGGELFTDGLCINCYEREAAKLSSPPKVKGASADD